MQEEGEVLTALSEEISGTRALHEGIECCREGRINRISGRLEVQSDSDNGCSHFDDTASVGVS